MKRFVAAIPLFGSNMSVEAYRLCDRDGERLLGSNDDHREATNALYAPGLEAVAKVGTEPFAADKPLLVDINEYQLLMGMPASMNLPPEKIVCVIPCDISTDRMVAGKLRNLKLSGYSIALDMYDNHIAAEEIFGLCDYLLFDCTEYKQDDLIKHIARNVLRKKVVISNIPDLETFEKYNVFSNAYFSGSFYSQPITEGVSEISPVKVNALRLMNQVNAEDFDLTEIADTIEKDTFLSISLLRFINFSFNQGSKRKIDSIRNAVAIMGQKEVKRWATVAIQLQLADDRPNEIARLSLIRARFAENLATVYELGMLAPSLFMAGLFSLLDVILQKPMAEAIKEVAVDERVRRALADRKGELYEVLDLIYAYERAEWDKASINIIRNNVNLSEVSAAFIEALIWYKQLLESIEEE